MEMVEPDQLLANPDNWRIHPREQQDAVEGLLSEVGWVDAIKVNVTTGHVLDGHLRETLALRRDQGKIPVLYVELSEDEEKLILASLDSSSKMAGTDRDKLDVLISEITTGDPGVQAMLSELWKVEVEQPRERAASAAADGGGSDSADDGDSSKGELEISAELLERYDYLVFYFDNELDWQVAVERFGVKSVLNAQVGTTTFKKKGVGRLLPAKELLERSA